ncbi:MAG: hypothetical protein K6B64_00315 [Acholeplasmatales bacterium]|nr:hypothetical protein [Acholeplasmatales bacterium]
MDNLEKEKKIKKLKRNLIVTIVAISVLVVVVLFFIFFYQAYNMLWTPLIFLGIMAVAIVFDKSKIKEIEEDNEDKPV